MTQGERIADKWAETQLPEIKASIAHDIDTAIAGATKPLLEALELAIDMARATMVAAQQDVIGTRQAESIFEREPFVKDCRALLATYKATSHD